VSKKIYTVRFDPGVVTELRQLARAVSFRRGLDVTWSDLIRMGAKMVSERLKEAESGQGHHD
jgi:hypothetical protein